MSKTLILQSHRDPLPYSWIQDCLDSVRRWSQDRGYEYRFIGDELFEGLTGEQLCKTKAQPVIASDLGRLHRLREALGEGYDCVVWMDADFLIFNPSNFHLLDVPYALGREVWVQLDRDGALKVYKKVHNAFLMFRRDNSFLSYYIETAERLLRLNSGSMPPQFIGPKLLTALHNIAQMPVMESAGMLSPMIINELIQNGDEGLSLFKQYSPEPIAAANLCISSCDREQLTPEQMQTFVTKVIHDKSL